MNKPKILIVEDNHIIALDIKQTLQNLNYTVTDIVRKESDVLNSIKTDEPNILLMDIDLKQKKNGVQIVNEIYKTKKIPVIYLSGIDDEELVNTALETKPAYYLTKPFNRIQLKSAIELVVDTHYKNYTHFKKLGNDYSFDVQNKKLYYKEEIQKLGTKEVQLLNLLIEANGKVVLFETIENIIWDNQSVTNDAIRLLVSRLRRKLKKNSKHKMIETIYSHGFKLKKLN